MKRILITGGLHTGKTTLAQALADALNARGVRTAGILAKGLWKNKLREGFDLFDLSTGRLTPLARRTEAGPGQTGTPYVFFDQGIAEGKRALSPDRCKGAKVIFIDEIGPLELKGLGWTSCLEKLFELKESLHIWIVRETLLDQVRITWPADTDHVVRITDPHALDTLITLCLA